MTTPGTCYGFGIDSDLPFEYLRSGTGEPLHVAEEAREPPESELDLAFEMLPAPGRPLHAKLFEVRGVGGYRLWTHDAGWFGIDPRAPSITVPPTAAPALREQRIWGLPVLLCFLARGDLPLHAAAVEIDGGALVFAAPSGHGKTTLAAACAAAGHRLLAEDLSCIRVDPDPVVVPGPASLRVRGDIASAVGLDHAEKVYEDDRIHLALDPSARGDCVPVPLRGVVLLREDDSRVRLEPASAADALKDLWLLSFRMPKDEDRRRCFEWVADLSAATGAWNLYRPLTVGSLPETIELLASLATKGVG